MSPALALGRDTGPRAHLGRGEQSQQSPCWEPGGGFVRLGGMETVERGGGEETAAREPRPPAMESCTSAPLTEVGWSLALCVFDECGWCKRSVKIKVVAEVRVHVDGRGKTGGFWSRSRTGRRDLCVVAAAAFSCRYQVCSNC